MELKDKVVVTEDDIRMVEDFFQNYNDPKKNNLVMTSSLRKELQVFKTKTANNSYNTEDQRRLTLALCKSLSDTTHELLRDEAIKEVLTATQTIWTDAQFYEEFEKAIRDPQDPQKEED